MVCTESESLLLTAEHVISQRIVTALSSALWLSLSAIRATLILGVLKVEHSAAVVFRSITVPSCAPATIGNALSHSVTIEFLKLL